MKILIGVIVILAILALFFFLIVKYDSVELDETSPFFNDEIESGGVDNIKLKMKEFKHITKSESIELCDASCDLESGNYLIRERTQERLNTIKEILEAERTENPTDRQKEILEWYKVCSDYFYAKKNGYLDVEGNVVDIKWKDNEE